jgi:tetratricopeptide (TPR) repeat protein
VERLVNRAIEGSGLQDIQTHERVLAIHRIDGNPDNILADLVWLATHYLRAENYKRAEPLVEEGLAIDPEDLGLRDCRLVLLRRTGRIDELQLRLRELADQMIGTGDLRRAAGYLKEFVDNNPERTDARRELADIWRRLGDSHLAVEEEMKSVGELLARDETEAARELADTIIGATPDDITVRERVATTFLEHRLPDAAARHFAVCAALAAKAGDADAQIRHLRSAAEARPRTPEPLRQLADAYAAAGRADEASDALGRLTDLFVDLRSFDQAVEVMRRRISASPKDAPLRRLLVDLFERTGNKEGRIVETQALADLLLSQGRFDEATEEYRGLVFLKPDDIGFLRKYIELFEQLGSEQELVDDYLRLADLHAQRGQFAEATQTFERAMAIDRRGTVAGERFVAFLLNCGQKSRALIEMARLAEQYTAAGQAANAIRVLEEAHKLNPQDPEVLLALATSLAASGSSPAEAAGHFESAAAALADRDPARALEALRGAVAAAPSRLDLRERLAPVLARVQDLPALAANERAMAELCAAKGDQKLAAQHRQKAAELAPRIIETLRARIAAGGPDAGARRDDLVALGDILAERGDVDEAIGMYRDARAIGDDSPDLIRKCIECVAMIAPEREAIPDLLALGAFHARAGQERKAREAFERVLALDPHSDAAKAGLGIGSKPRARGKPGAY